jgi:hypothetical protein
MYVLLSVFCYDFQFEAPLVSHRSDASNLAVSAHVHISQGRKCLFEDTAAV